MADDRIIFEVIATAKGVKVVQQQTDKLAASTDRADKSTKKLDKSRDAYNRREKGAAQISSNQTKNFSKMQQGIDGGGGSGGLVRAYALLAANVFALTAAFGVLSRSAQIDTLTQSMEVLSTTGGTYIKNLAKDMQEASGFAIDLAQAFSQVSLASSAGLSTKEIEGLTQVAKGAAISLGRNLPDAMDRIFRGAIKLEPEILDEIGLFVRVDEAAQKYARNNGKVVSSLSQVEKRQAFLNEILEQGEKKFATYADTIKPDPYVRLGAALGDIAQGGLSLVNSVLGPLLGFLSESQGLLTAVFGTLVAVLLKKAIPAMGLMTKNAAELAQERAESASEYSKSITEQTDRAIKADMDELKSARKTNAEKMKMDKRFASRSKLPGADTTKLDKAKLGSANRLARVEERIVVLKKAQNDKDNESQRLIKAELAALQEEERIEKRLVKLKASGGVATGSLAERRQDKLDSQSRVSGAVAMAAGTMETQGITAGFADLNEELRTQIDVNGELEDKYTKTEKAKARLKGGVSALGIQFNKLMMIMGPAMMIFAMISPLLIAAANAMGLNSKEAKEFDSSLKQLSEASENLDKRFKSQTDQLKSGKLTFVESTKAQLAFSRGMVEASENTQEMNKKLDAFKKESSDAARGWEAFKGLFGLDKESQALDQQLETVKKQIEGIVRNSGVEGAEAFMNITGAREFANVMETVIAAEDEFTRLRNERNANEDTAIGTKESELLMEYQRAVKKISQTGASDLLGPDRFMAAGMEVSRLQALLKEIGTDTTMIDAAKAEAVAQAQLLEVRRKVVGTRQQMSDAQEQEGKRSAAEVKRLEILDSVLEGANESMGKFTQSFQIKTKADDLNNSLSAMQDSITGVGDMAGLTEKELNDFFTKMEDESDNAFSKLFSTKEIEEFKAGTMDAFTDMVNKVKEYQHNVISTKNKQAELKREIKEMNDFAAAGQKMNEMRFQKEADMAKNTHTLAKQEHELNLAANKLSQEQLETGMGILEGTETMLEKEDLLKGHGLTREQIMAAQQSHLAEQTAEMQAQLAEETKLERAKKLTAEAALKTLEAEKQLTDAKNERAKLELKLASSRTGGDPRAVDIVQQELKAAKDTFQFEVDSAKLKMAVLSAEHEILKIRMKLFFLEAGMATKDKDGKITLGTEAQELMTTLGKGFESKQSAIGVGIQNAALRFGIATTEAIGKSFKAGSGSGILGAIRGAAAGVAATGEDGLVDSGMKDAEGNAIRVEGLTAEEAAVQVLKSSYQELIETMGDLGPAGKVVAGIAQGSMTILTGYENMIAGNKAIDAAVADTTNNFSENDRAMAQAANTAETAASALSGIGQMMAANSAGQVAEIDQQINAEKRRDGKSKESLAKIAQLEKKKEAMQRKAFEQNKKVQMAVTIANTAASIMAALSAPPIGLGPVAGMPMAIMAGAMGALQLAVIAKTKYQGGGSSVEKPSMQKLSVGKRDNTVDVSRGPAGGELAYMRGQRGVGSNANDFRPTGGAYGLKSYAATGEGILVGEQGPEVVTPTQPVDVLPMTSGGAQNVTFTINAVDAEGVESVLERQRGNIIGMIRSAANGYGENFLEQVDTDIIADGGYQKV